ncbi:MAG TPA: hypothetical protein DDZ88_06910 [Verrucomicrobiales bacterium]|nr:hypothetical protein [Verrucomicrobiales bacterium]
MNMSPLPPVKPPQRYSDWFLPGPLLLLLLVIWLGVVTGPEDAEIQGRATTAKGQAAGFADADTPKTNLPNPAASSAGRAVPPVHPAFGRSGSPSKVKAFPRGPNGERRHHAPVVLKLPVSSRQAEPLSMALTPADGRAELLPDEVDLHTKTARRMVLDTAVLEAVAAGKTARLIAPLPDGSPITLVIDTVKNRGGTTHTLQGEVEGEPQVSVVQLVYHDGIVHGSVARFHLDQEIEYRIMADGHMMVRELDQSSLRDVCGDPGEAPQAGAGDTGLEQTGAAEGDTAGYTTVDIVAGYDREARTADGGQSQIEARIIASVDRMNLAFGNSLITSTELMLLGTVEDPDYVFPGQTAGEMGGGDELGDLDNTSASNPRLNTVSDYANALGADLKALIVKQSDGSAGVAYRPGSSSITARDYMTATRITFAHELGHNFGARHSWGDTSGSDAVTNVHAYGWRLAPAGQPRVRTIMAYDWSWGSGVRIPYFSNPDVSYQGARTGQVNGYNATGDALSDPRYVSGGYVGGLGAGFDGTNSSLGARNAHHLQGSASGRANLQARAAFQVVTPALHAYWKTEETYEIYWTGGDYEDSVQIELYKGGVLQAQIASGLRGDERRFGWLVPGILTSGGDYMIRVRLNGAQMADSPLFTIARDGLSVSPTTLFSASGDEGGPFQPAQQVYTLSNFAGSTIDWTATVDVPWLLLSHSSGTLAAGASLPITASISGAGSLPVGTYEAAITFADTTSGIQLLRQASLQVVGYPALQVEHPEGVPVLAGTGHLNFGEVLAGSRAVRRLALRNTGSAPLVLGAATLTGVSAGQFETVMLTGSTVEPGESAFLDVRFRPINLGSKTALLQIASNDPARPVFQISLAGTGTPVGGDVELALAINTSMGGLGPINLTSAGSYAVFSANTPENGQEVWRSDGTEAGTFILKDIVAGTLSSTPGNFAAVGPLVYFSANNLVNGSELWVTDGTGAGTRLVSDIASGSTSSSPANMTAMGGHVFFRATNGTQGIELWKSDGTSVGTVLVKDIAVGSASSTPSNLTGAGSTLFFTASTTTEGMELWKSDGTSAGTVLVKDIIAGSTSSFPANLTAVGSTLFFTVSTSAEGSELWKSDGTEAGTELVKDINPGTSSSSPSNLVAMNEVLYFRATTADEGTELWRSDGGSAGTQMVAEIQAGSGSGAPGVLHVHAGLLYLVGNNGTNGSELWVSDGTEEGTRQVKDIQTGSSSSTPQNFRSVGGMLYFTAFNAAGRELWKTDGTEAGTVLVRDIAPGSTSSTPTLLVAAGDLLLFSGNDGSTGSELWRSDGTQAGTTPVADFVPGVAGSTLLNLREVNGSLCFSANDGVNGAELWRSNGTPSATQMVKDINTGSSSSSPAGMTAFDAGAFVFSASSSTTGVELFKSDGTSGGTVLVKDINPGTLGSSANNFLRIGSQVYFSAATATNGNELWKTDGTSVGTVMVADAVAGSGSASPTSLVHLNGLVIYRATTSAAGTEVWRSDGTTEGTFMLKDINPGSASSSPLLQQAGVVGNTLFFTATTAAAGAELWKTDGTSDGTVLVKDIRPGSLSASPASFLSHGGSAYFSATDGVNGIELWKSDGTADGTVMVADINPGSSGSSASGLASFGPHVYFSATNGSQGLELWKSDGTSAGTTIVRDLFPGPSSSSPVSLIMHNGELFFHAQNDTVGAELWRTDGTTEGTVLVADIFPGPGSSTPSSLVSVGSRLFFTAVHPSTSSQLFSLDTGPRARISVEHPLASELANGLSQVDFGTATTGTAGFTRTFAIKNSGTGVLSGLAVSLPTGTGFQIDSPPAASVPPDGQSTFAIVFSPTAAGFSNAALQISSNDPAHSPFVIHLTGEGVTASQLFTQVLVSAGVSGPDQSPQATPHHDGVANLLKYAFRMNLGGPDSRAMTPGGSNGLPAIAPQNSGPERIFRFEFVRRVGSGLQYVPQMSASLLPGSWNTLTSSPQVTPIDSEWERVVYEEPVPSGNLQRFGRVEVVLP